MDLLKEVIEGLDETERKEFKTFINRFRKKSSRIDLQLFNLYCTNKYRRREEIISMLYQEDSKVEAYHGTRRRLVKHLVEFIPLHMKSAAAGSERSIENLLLVSRFLFGKQLDKAAWTFLKQAEETAKKAENYNLLNMIYSMQIEYSGSDFAPDLKAIILQKEKYQRLAMEDDNANIANQVIRYELENSKRDGKEIELDKIIRNVLRKYDLKEEVLRRPKLIYNIMAIVRSSILFKKDFHHFEPYVEAKYKEVEKKGYFNEFNHYYKVNMLYMLAHVKYRNKRFGEAERYLELLHENINLYQKSEYFRIYPKYILLLAAVKSYSGHNKNAIPLLENLLGNKKIKLTHAVYFNSVLNLITYYFQMENYKKAIRLYQEIGSSDKWLTKIMGKEWVLKKGVAEILIQYELGNSDMVDKRIQSLLKGFKDIFHRPVYKRIEIYLSLVKKLNDNPHIASTQSFREMLDEAFEYVSMEEEDIQATTAFCWLKAKATNRKYYDVLVYTVNFRSRIPVEHVEDELAESPLMEEPS